MISVTAQMYIKRYLALAMGGLPVLAMASSSSADGDQFKEYTISANNITAKFIPYGARMTFLLVPDRSGNLQDVVFGYDNPKDYLQDTKTVHTYAGAVVGRYGNRIKNGTFTLNMVQYNFTKNDNGGLDTLNGGTVGYDQRSWTVTSHTDSSITFTLFDNAEEGFPGEVLTHAIYQVQSTGGPDNPTALVQLTTKIISMSLSDDTPLMPANNIYWNLNAFQNATILNDTYLQLPFSVPYIATNGILVPNGPVMDVSNTYGGSPDFSTGKYFGADISKAMNLCGTGCTDYDTCYIVDGPSTRTCSAASRNKIPSLKMSSDTTGISIEMASNMPALQVYTCNKMDGTIPVKDSQVKRNKAKGKGGVRYVNKCGCIVIQPEGWIDGITQMQWGQLPYQTFSPNTGTYIHWATYQFGTV